MKPSRLNCHVRCRAVASAACSVVLIATPAACTTRAPLAVLDSTATPATTDRTGGLVVYSATYASTIEQSEYPAHTNYTISTVGDKVIRRVTNLAGPFNSYPAKVSLPVGDYHVRAQFDRGGFVVVPLSIASGRTTIVDLSHEPLPAPAVASRKSVRLPDGRVVGWLATDE